MKEQTEADYYKKLARKWMEGTITPSEAEQFSEWYNEGQDEPIFIEADFAEGKKELKDRIMHKVKVRKSPRRLNLLQVAAVFCIILSVGILLYKTYYAGLNDSSDPQPTELVVSEKQEGAILTLANGTSINLDEAAVGQVGDADQSKIIKLNKGQLAFKGGAKAGMNELKVPTGETFQIILPDGSKVWLNSKSSLRFPSAFKEDERLVELRGEGYFEITAHKNKPFKVLTRRQVVKVLGTHFNVKAYIEDPTVQTTLLEGKVTVNALRFTRSVLLKPNQQASLSADGLNVKKVVASRSIGWKESQFVLDDEDIQSIMRMLERWYGVEVVYVGSMPKEKFEGAIPKYKSIDNVLEILSSTGKVKFATKDNKITVFRN